MIENQTQLIGALRSKDAYPHECNEIQLIETHISWILLTGRYAYKVKKAVRLAFLDFSTLELRERYCEDELSLNRRLAPEIYLEVVPIGGSLSEPQVGALPAIEYAVRMRQFAPDAGADALIRNDQLEADALERLAERIAAFHASLPAQALPDSGHDVVANLFELESLLPPGSLRELTGIAARLRDENDRLDDTRRERALQGHVRECHGDLHLGNIVRLDSELVPFDCLEFNRELRTIDVIDEIAFLVMDLMAHARRDLALRFLNRYLEITGGYDGLQLLRLFAAHRALVRAKVAVLQHQARSPEPDAGTQAYLDAASAALADSGGALLMTCGLSGSGKSTVARKLASLLGAVCIRSDVERKRLHAMAPTDRRGDGLEQGIYSREASAATYARLLDAAESALAGRLTIIVDAAFLSHERRREFAALARSHHRPWLILHCVAPARTLRARLARRACEGADASDADTAILEHQLETADAISADESECEVLVDTEREIDVKALAEKIARLTQVSLSSTSY